MSRCCRISSMPTSISALTPRTPIVPSMLASQPGDAIVNCHGSLSVIDGGAPSFGASSTVPAVALPTAASSALAKKNNLILTGVDSMVTEAQTPRKFLSLVLHDLGTLEAKTGHETLLIEGES